MNIFADLLPPTSAKAAKKQAAQAGPTIQKQRRGIEIKSKREIEIMRKASAIVATTLKEIMEITEPGMTTADLDAYAEKRIREMGAEPSFKGYCGFPASICSSINNEVVHGIPNKKKVIRAGDVVKVDTGAFYNGFHGDSCVTILVGETTPEAQRLTRVAEEALFAGIYQVKPGARLVDLAVAIEDVAKAAGFAIVEDFTGHGVGRNLHEEPAVFNYRTRSIPKVKLRPGMVLAIEPILNAGKKTTKILSDRWTAVTTDRSLSAQWEHTVLVTKDGYEILTDRTKV